MDGYKPIIADDYLLIVGYNDTNNRLVKHVYKLPVDDIITSLGNQKQTSDTTAKWITMSDTTHRETAIVPGLSPPVVVGGLGQFCSTTSDVKMYDDSSKSWKMIASLSSTRSSAAAAALYNNSIIVIGGLTQGRGMDTINSTLTTVELGQAQIIQ